jgi:hypothetical protein
VKRNGPLAPKDLSPSDLAALSNAELVRLAGQLQEEVFRECNGRAGQASDGTLHRQSLVELELSLRDLEPSVSPGPA